MRWKNEGISTKRTSIILSARNVCIFNVKVKVYCSGWKLDDISWNNEKRFCSKAKKRKRRKFSRKPFKLHYHAKCWLTCQFRWMLSNSKTIDNRCSIKVSAEPKCQILFPWQCCHSSLINSRCFDGFMCVFVCVAFFVIIIQSFQNGCMFAGILYLII